MIYHHDTAVLSSQNATSKKNERKTTCNDLQEIKSDETPKSAILERAGNNFCRGGEAKATARCACARKMLFQSKSA